MTDQSDFPETPWLPSEKTYLLAEMIKFSRVDPQVLFNTIQQGRLPLARFDEIGLPPGRSLKSCQRLYDNMLRTFPNTLPPQQTYYTPNMQGSAPHTPTPMPGYSRNAPQSVLAPSSGPSALYSYSATGRLIRPKSSMPGAEPQQSPLNNEPPKKKRGRPTKAEAQAKAEASAQTGGSEAGPSSRPPSQHITTAVTTAASTPVQRPSDPVLEEERPSAPPPQAPPPSTATTKVSIAAILTPTVSKRDSPPSNSSGSSGKRRRNRLRQQEEAEEARVSYASSRRQENNPEYASPYATRPLTEGLGDTPARAAIIRHAGVENLRKSRSPPRIGSLTPSEPRTNRPTDPSRL